MKIFENTVSGQLMKPGKCTTDIWIFMDFNTFFFLNPVFKGVNGPLAIKWVFLNVTQEWCNIHLNVIQSDFTTFRMTTNLYWYELGHMVASSLI